LRVLLDAADFGQAQDAGIECEGAFAVGDAKRDVMELQAQASG
jgi:hypothetical protein